MILTDPERPYGPPPDRETDEEYHDRLAREADKADHDNQCAKDLEP